MEKKTINVHAFSIHLYALLVILLFLLCGVLALKYFHLEMKVKEFTASTIWMNSQNKEPSGQINDYGKIIAVTTAEYIPTANLQDYVSTLSEEIKRDITVLNTDKKILADMNPKNVNLVYNYDLNGEIKMSLADGQARVFEEKSEEFPNGIAQVVIPMRDSSGKITGAVLISNTPLESSN